MVRETRDKVGPIPLKDLELQDFTDLDVDNAYSPGFNQRMKELIESRKRKPKVRIIDMDIEKKE
jgi:hypothetical protein